MSEVKFLSTNKLATQSSIVERPTRALPQGVQEPLFSVSGRVIVTHIIGEVTTVIQTQANDTKLVVNPTVGADVDICAVLDITGDAVGTMYNITGTLANAMVATTSGAMIAQASPIIVADGSIDLNCAASNTGAVKWTLHYIPLDAGSYVEVSYDAATTTTTTTTTGA